MSIETNSSSKTPRSPPTKTVGLIVNPVAGMGGAVGLKGTDGKSIVNQAISLGAKPVAPARAEAFLSKLNPVKNSLRLFVGAGSMGEDETKTAGFSYTALGERKKETSAEDTVATAKKMADADVALLIFCGGDGTARDVLTAVGTSLPVLGVPTGVKMHSAVFAVNPRAAARVVIRFLYEGVSLREAEVMDVDEEAFREGRVSAELYGYVLAPYEPHLIQANKLASPITESELRSQAAIATYIIENMKPDVIYIIGPGTTTRTISDLLDAKKTLLGVDIFHKKKLVANDVNEKQILEAINREPVQIIVTPIGGQGFIFGRGNQQISPKVIRRVGLDNIIVVATERKLRSVKTLRVDTGDPSLDTAFRERQMKVVVDYSIKREMRVE
ncbi:MAG: ATP-NAD kinase family protein [Candidatus Bathyarchaeia archaeon]|nr:ATP-NAD kinase family protein [Candidatus Bathyarchaeia archaeon]